MDMFSTAATFLQLGMQNFRQMTNSIISSLLSFLCGSGLERPTQNHKRRVTCSLEVYSDIQFNWPTGP